MGVLVLGGFILVLGGFIIFAKSQMTKLSNRVAGVQSAISQQRTISSQLISLREDKELASKYETTINILIPTRRQLFDLQRWLGSEAQARNAGLTFNYVGEQKDPEGGSLGHLPFSMRLSGQTVDLIGFLDFLENKTPQFLMSFDDLSVGVSREGVNQVALKGKVYFRADE